LVTTTRKGAYSLLTASRIIVLQPLVKSFCKKYGLVQRVRAAYFGLTSYNEKGYANYYGQPFEEIFNLKNYK